MSGDAGMGATALTDSGVARLVELSEARAYARLISGAPKDLGEQQYGLAVHRVGSAYAFVTARFCDSLILNRVIGLGIGETVTEDTLAALDILYRANGVTTYATEVSPASEPRDLPERLRMWGFVPFKQTTMLYYHRGDPVASVESDLSVRRVGPENSVTFADITCRTFGFNEPFPTLLRATFECPAWQHWLAFDGEQPVAASITHVEDQIAWIGWSATLPECRGRGAHGAMVRAQLLEASASDFHWATAEVATGTKNRPSQALRNCLRVGWTVAYDRLVYVRKSEQRA